YVGDLLRELGGHLGTVGLVSAVRDFLKCLSLDVELSDGGEFLRLLVAERGRSNVEDGSKIFGRKNVTQLAQHVDEDVGGGGGNSSGGGDGKVARHGVIGAEDE